jgi:beta-lactamase class A
MITWATVDPTGGTADGGGRQGVPAASTIKLFVYSAFRRSELDPDETVPPSSTGGSGVAEYLQTPLTFTDHAFLMLAVSDNASTNLLLDRLGFQKLRLAPADTDHRRVLAVLRYLDAR